MIEASWNQKNLDSFYSKMNKIVNNLATYTFDAVEKASEDTREYALNQKRGSKDDDFILKKLNKEAKQIIARVYTNFSYAPFLEYGTGIYAEMPHIGKTKTFIESGYRYWYLPVDKVEKNLNNQIISIKGEQFYVMHSTQPYPFMRPTAFYMKPKNIETIKNTLRERILSDIK